jgi:hypothetical protein
MFGRLRHSTLVAFVTASGLFVLAGAAPRRENRRAIERPHRAAVQQERAAAASCGQDYLATIDLVPDAVVSSGASERIEYHAEISVLRGTNVGVAWESDVVDDRGAVVVSNLARGTARSQNGDVVVGSPIAANLTNGFYAVRAKAAVSADGEPVMVVEHAQYIQVSNGKWAELTDVEWANSSRARLAHSADGKE